MFLQKTRARHAGFVAFALSCVFAIDAAHAAGTDAGTSVSNTFTLDYQVGGVSQTQITPGAPTTFTVDRKIDLDVASLGDVNVSPGATGQQLVFRVRNDGNDNQAYSLSLEDLAGDDFDATLAAAATIYVDDGDQSFEPGGDDGAGVAYTLGSPTASGDIAPDAFLWVVISGDIPGGRPDGDIDGVILLADTLNPATSLDPGYTATPGTEANGSGVANVENGEAQNVLADGTGAALPGSDGANDGTHSGLGRYVVQAADLTASKIVTVIATDSTSITCASDPVQAGNQYAVPDACIEYVISVTNDAGAPVAATSIDIADTLPAEVALVGAVAAGFTTPGTLTTAAPCPADPCVVAFSGGSLDPGDTGTITIRATVR